MTNDLTGWVIKGYELRERIGAGGMGAVYRAYQPAVGREVAVKVILPGFANQTEFIRRFETEAQLVARLEHPFIVPLFDYWRDPDGAYLVMRLFRGGSLRNALDAGRIAPERAVTLVDQIAGALAVAHRHNIIHRDLKPDNILLDEDGNAFLTDFGIAKINTKPTTRGTQTLPQLLPSDLALADDITEIQPSVSPEEDDEGIAGSPGYMSPEQIVQNPISARADIYSLGIILYEMMTGTHPFPGSSVTELIYNHLQDPVPLLGAQVPHLPETLNEIIQKATAKDPDDRYPDTLTLAAAFRAALAQQHRLDDRFMTHEIDLITVNPYKGLRPFEEADAQDFFGREALVAQLAARLQETTPEARFLAVVGPSGSGKSSVVKAGLLPTLRWGEVPGSEHWFITEMVPGLRPLDSLAATLRGVAFTPADIASALHAAPTGLTQAAAMILPPDAELLLVIDQFEEVFTLVEDEAERSHFLNLMRVAVMTPGSRVRVIVTLRADFYDRPLLYEGFGSLMRLRTEVVLPLAAEELERAITGPAERVGLRVDANLLAAIVADVREEPGALPLLQYVLTEVYERRDGRSLTLAGYQASGGALGALARRADELYSGMDDAHQDVTRQLFLRLVTLGEGTEDTRRRVLRSELMAIKGGGPALEDVLEIFGKYRLLSFDRDPQTREPTIEVAHEALMREWKKLREWLSTSREDVRLQRSLAAAAGDWVEHQRDNSYLLREYRLRQFEEWANSTSLALTQSERDYLTASIALREKLSADESARLAREKRLEQQSRRRLRLVAVVMALAFVGALIAAAIAFNLREIAQLERNNAATAAADARVQQVIAQNEAALSRSLALSTSADQVESVGNHDLALALILEANAIPNPPAQSQRLLAQIGYAPGAVGRLSDPNGQIQHTASVASVAYSPDGHYILSASDDNNLILWDAQTRHPVRVMSQHTLPAASVAFSPTGQFAVSGSWDSTLIVWDIASGRALAQLRGHRGVVRAVVITPDGRFALSGSSDGVIVWNLAAGTIAQRYQQVGSVYSLALDAGGAALLIGTEDGEIVQLELETGFVLQTLRGHSSLVLSVAYSPDRRRMISASRDNSILVWDLATGRILRRLNQVSSGHTGSVNSIAFTPDGAYALTAADDTTLIVWDMTTYTVVRKFGGTNSSGEHLDRVTSVVMSPNGDFAATGSADRTVIVWSVFGGALQTTYRDHQGSVLDVRYNPDGTRLFSAGEDGTLILREAASGAIEREFVHPEGMGVLTAAAVSPDQMTLAVGFDDGAVIFWNTAAGESWLPSTSHTAGITVLVFSPDSSQLLSGSDDNTLILWDVATGAALKTFSGHTRRVLSAAFSPDGATILSGSFDRTLILWDVATARPIHTFAGHERRVLSVAYSPDGRYALSGSDDTNIILWDVATGEEVRRFDVGSEGGGQTVYSVAFSPGGFNALSGAEDGRLTLWDVATGQVIRRLQAPSLSGSQAEVTRVAFRPDGQVALAGLRDGRVMVWRVPPLAELIAWIRANRFVPSLTCVEREQYRVIPLCGDADAGLVPPVPPTP